MKIQPIETVNNTHFGILKGIKQRPYGEYMWGEYKGHKVEVFNAYKNNQFLIYVSKNMRFIKSKLTYWVDGVKKIARAENKNDSI